MNLNEPIALKIEVEHFDKFIALAYTRFGSLDVSALITWQEKNDLGKGCHTVNKTVTLGELLYAMRLDILKTIKESITVDI